jgi:hypothetical protein
MQSSGSQYLTHPITTTVMGFVGEEELNLCSLCIQGLLLLVHYSLPALLLTLG